MKTLSLFCFLLLCTSAVAQQSPAPLRVMSFNIRYGLANDGENHWKHRDEHVIATIKKFNPDLLGTQETLKFQAEYLKSKLTDYEHFGRSREAKNEEGEQTAIFYRRDRFQRMGAGHFWLSETPEKVGSKSWDSSLPRMASWVKLKDTKTNESLVFLNTHFDHRGSEARRQSAITIRNWFSKIKDTQVIVTGDFNCAEKSGPYEQLVTKSELVDAYRIAHPERGEQEGTFNGWKPRFTGGRIDWILSTPDLQVKSAKICRDEYDGHFPSDHFPVTAILQQK